MLIINIYNCKKKLLKRVQIVERRRFFLQQSLGSCLVITSFGLAFEDLNLSQLNLVSQEFLLQLKNKINLLRDVCTVIPRLIDYLLKQLLRLVKNYCTRVSLLNCYQQIVDCKVSWTIETLNSFENIFEQLLEEPSFLESSPVISRSRALPVEAEKTKKVKLYFESVPFQYYQTKLMYI